MDYRNWHRDGNGHWHVQLDDADYPVCGTEAELVDEVFHGGVTLQDMCPACREFHLS